VGSSGESKHVLGRLPADLGGRVLITRVNERRIRQRSSSVARGPFLEDAKRGCYPKLKRARLREAEQERNPQTSEGGEDMPAAASGEQAKART